MLPAMGGVEPLRYSNRLAYQARVQRIWAAGIDAPYGVRKFGRRVLVPVMRHGAVRNLQIIEPDGGTRFLTRGKTRGCYYIIGQPGDLIMVVVGFLDAVRWHEDLGVACVVAFEVENMLHVIRRIWLDHDARIIVLTESFDSRIQIAAQAMRAAYLRSDLTEWGKSS